MLQRSMSEVVDARYTSQFYEAECRKVYLDGFAPSERGEAAFWRFGRHGFDAARDGPIAGVAFPLQRDEAFLSGTGVPDFACLSLLALYSQA